MSDHMNQMTPAAALLGREVIEADKVTGEVRVRFLAKHDFTNRHGTVQGGFLAAMLDSATGNAVMAMLPSEQTAVHTRLDISFLKPAGPGPLTPARSGGPPSAGRRGRRRRAAAPPFPAVRG